MWVGPWSTGSSQCLPQVPWGPCWLPQGPAKAAQTPPQGGSLGKRCPGLPRQRRLAPPSKGGHCSLGPPDGSGAGLGLVSRSEPVPRESCPLATPRVVLVDIKGLREAGPHRPGDAASQRLEPSPEAQNLPESCP